MNPGIVLCTRLNSKRLKEKPLAEIAGRPAIRLLVDRLIKTSEIPICIALAGNKEDEKIVLALNHSAQIVYFSGHPTNVLARLYWAAETYGFDPIIRITHDDILQDGEFIEGMLTHYYETGADYTYVSHCVRGMDVEIISRKLLETAYLKFKHIDNTEEISFILKNPELNPVIKIYNPPLEYQSGISMSLDTQEDLTALRLLFGFIHPLASGKEIVQTLNAYPEINMINHKPELTIYTCAYNAEKTLKIAAASVLSLLFQDFEYIIHDDGSSDNTAKIMIDIAQTDKRIKIQRTAGNVGLASSCNSVMQKMQGEICIRLDADDELLPEIVREPIECMRRDSLLAALYPAYYRDNEVIQNTEHHIGGSLFRSRVLKELRFCDGLRHWEGKELYHRLKERYHIMEYPDPTWIYHNTENSLSNCKDERRKFFGEIYCKH